LNILDIQTTYNDLNSYGQFLVTSPIFGMYNKSEEYNLWVSPSSAGGSSGASSVFTKVLRAAEFDGVGYKVSGDTRDVQLLLEDFLYMFMRPARSMHETFFLYKKKNFWSWDCLLKCQIIRISEL
jgi:hypothetical protein